jgi:hypothetical protein
MLDRDDVPAFARRRGSANAASQPPLEPSRRKSEFAIGAVKLVLVCVQGRGHTRPELAQEELRPDATGSGAGSAGLIGSLHPSTPPRRRFLPIYAVCARRAVKFRLPQYPLVPTPSMCIAVSASSLSSNSGRESQTSRRSRGSE